MAGIPAGMAVYFLVLRLALLPVSAAFNLAETSYASSYLSIHYFFDLAAVTGLPAPQISRKMRSPGHVSFDWATGSVPSRYLSRLRQRLCRESRINQVLRELRWKQISSPL